MSGEKVVSHADLPVLHAMRDDLPLNAYERRFVDRLIAAAEADAPPLPEGWVLHQDGGHQHPYYHQRGWLYRGCDVDGGCVVVARVGEGRFTRDRLTPLRPTVTEADEARAAEVIREAVHVGTTWQIVVRRVLDALGIEVAR